MLTFLTFQKMKVLTLCFLTPIFTSYCYCFNTSLPPTCDSKIYCQGPLLHTIQMSKIYKDAKTFVDMKMKLTADEILTNFNTMMNKTENKPSKEDILGFLSNNFDDVGLELDHWVPRDWVEHPKLINSIKNKQFKQWALELNEIWKHLVRKCKKSVKINPEQYSIIWTPNPVVVPGGRFREFYYWDTYWIILGLLHSEMFSTAKGVLENFLYIVDKFGHVPNGGRIYYLTRSQPPMLISMVKLYVDATNDHNFIKKNIDLLDKEFDYWMENYNRTVKINNVNYTLAAYRGGSTGPRPESYWNDVEAGLNITEETAKEEFYIELKAGAESGWDYSTRWFIKNGQNKGQLTDLKVRSIIPVDLNAILYWNMNILEDFHHQLKDSKEKKYTNLKIVWLTAIEKVLWHEDLGIWLDYDLANSKRRDYFYISNMFPLWTRCFELSKVKIVTKKVLNYLKTKKVLLPGGIPSSMIKSGQQWDYPNAWPPHQHMIIVALHNTGEEEAKKYAFELAKRWVDSNYESYQKKAGMYEKYNAEIIGYAGGGGEYEVQLGFGWTNGVILDLLYRYGNELGASKSCKVIFSYFILVLTVVHILQNYF